MQRRHTEGWNRREFLGMTLAATGGLFGLKPRQVNAEPPPETTTLRLVQAPTSICEAPQYVAEELLRSEGFTLVQYIKKRETSRIESALASGEANISMDFVAPFIIRLDAGDPIVILAGGHVGCFELFGTERVRAIHDLKGQTVAVTELGGPQHIFLASIAAYVGLDPRRDIHWVTYPSAEAMLLLAEGKIDAFMGFPPEPQGRTTSAAWWLGTETSSRSIRWLPSGRCAPS
jgi:NitT/TauT family transport system substrate-binding protein